ncbi:MAG: ion channel [Marinobacter sp.]|uniref:ion channel n=1 Tax=Marinobacter sp. TaxID=50741 RepID=UPI00299DF1BE|nr:ion channel [Marinobacter sp.]MDX1634999.1 ion channel [Marinobacter sp.]
MLGNRQALNPEHQLSHLPMAGIIRSRLKRLFIALGVLVLLQVIVLTLAEDLTVFEAAYLTMTTLTTVGYGDFVPKTTIGRVSTMVVMYVLAITLLTLIISDFIEYRFYRRERMVSGRWIYPMKNHIVIINTPRQGGEQYFHRVASQLRQMPSYETVPIQILTQQYSSGLPPELKDEGLTHYHGAGSDPRALKAVHIADARHILLLAPDEAEPESDSLTFDIAHRLSELKLAHRVTVECVRDENRARFKALGVQTIIRPVRTYPEIMVRAVVSPGTEKVLEDLFNYQQDHPHRYELSLDDLTWSDIVSALIRDGIGTALAYIDLDGEVVCHPDPKGEVEGKGLIVLVKSQETPGVEVVEEALERHRQFIRKWHDMQKRAGNDVLEQNDR